MLAYHKKFKCLYYKQADKDAELAAKWKHCALTSEELKLPVVSCELGR